MTLVVGALVPYWSLPPFTNPTCPHSFLDVLGPVCQVIEMAEAPEIIQSNPYFWFCRKENKHKDRKQLVPNYSKRQRQSRIRHKLSQLAVRMLSTLTHNQKYVSACVQREVLREGIVHDPNACLYYCRGLDFVHICSGWRLRTFIGPEVGQGVRKTGFRVSLPRGFTHINCSR